MSKAKTKAELKNSAYGLIRGDDVLSADGETIQKGAWQLVKIPYDLSTGLLGDVSVVEVEDLRYGFERLNVELEQEILVTEE